jgi:PKD repeat protein
MRVALLCGLLAVGAVGCVAVPNQPPVAAITAAPISGGVPLTVQFDASGSRDPDGKITEYFWDFGDGSTGSGVKVSHTYTHAGLYPVILTVKDDRGSTAVATVIIKVGNPPPKAIFTVTATNGFAPLTVQFDASASSDPAALLAPQRIVRHEWDFGDGTSAVGQQVSHVYTRAGVYTVTLRVFDEDGASDRAQKTLRVLDFSFPISVPVGLSPTALAVGDFDDDRVDEIAVANFESRTVTVLRSDGTGNFRIKTTLALTHRPTSLIVGDFNQDKKLDLIVTNFDDGRISIFHGDGAGQLTPTRQIIVGAGPYTLLSDDFNRDQILDVAIANAPLGRVTTLVGDGTGDFSKTQEIAVGGWPSALAVGDFNDDGRRDIAVVNFFDDTVTVLLGNGDGTFEALTPFSVGKEPISLAVGDLNGDGFDDLAVAVSEENSVKIFLGRGTGRFREGPVLSVGPESRAVQIADLDQDGSLDLIATSIQSNELKVFLGRGDGSFGVSKIWPVGAGPIAIATGRFSGGDFDDIAVAQFISGHIAILLNRMSRAP